MRCHCALNCGVAALSRQMRESGVQPPVAQEERVSGGISFA